MVHIGADLLLLNGQRCVNTAKTEFKNVTLKKVCAFESIKGKSYLKDNEENCKNLVILKIYLLIVTLVI